MRTVYVGRCRVQTVDLERFHYESTFVRILSSCAYIYLRVQRGNLCQDPAGNGIKRRPPNHRKEKQTEWYGHVSRSSGLAKTTLQGAVK